MPERAKLIAGRGDMDGVYGVQTLWKGIRGQGAEADRILAREEPASVKGGSVGVDVEGDGLADDAPVARAILDAQAFGDEAGGAHVERGRVEGAHRLARGQGAHRAVVETDDGGVRPRPDDRHVGAHNRELFEINAGADGNRGAPLRGAPVGAPCRGERLSDRPEIGRTLGRHAQHEVFGHGLEPYLWTRPEASPPMSFSASPGSTRAKSPEIECFRQDRATAYSSALRGSP